MIHEINRRHRVYQMVVSAKEKNKAEELGGVPMGGWAELLIWIVRKGFTVSRITTI